MNAPGLANIDCQRLVFQPGDRILVRHNGPLDKHQCQKLTKTIVDWAGCEVRVLIINTQQFDIAVEKLPIIGS